MEFHEIPLFHLLPPREIQILEQRLIRRSLPAGEIVFHESEAGDRLSIILAGEVEIIKAIGSLDEWLVAVLGPGDFIGEMSLLYPDRLRSASVRARSELQILEMTQHDFYDLLQRHPDVALHIMQEMSLRLRNSEDSTIRGLQQKNIELSQAYEELKAAQEQLIEKERMEHELMMARKIQESILPRHLPDLPGWNVAAHWQPARSVSGDFYDFVNLPDGLLGIFLGDVTDKGVPAALVMATTRNLLRYAVSSAAELGPVSPATVLAHVNNALYEDLPVLMFVTCLFAILQPETGHLLFANAGQNLPYLCSEDGVVKLTATGMPLGLLPDLSYEDKEAMILPGNRLFLYSDGMIEAHNPQGEMFGTPRLCDNLLRTMNSPISGEVAVGQLLTDLQNFTGSNWEQEDDVTMVIIDRDRER